MQPTRALLISGLMLALAVTCSVAALGQENPDQKATTPKATEKDLAATIDREIAAVWKRDGIRPAKASSDEEFVRRVYLDLTGLPPTRDEAVAFLDSKEKLKRETLIATLIDDKRFGEHMGDLWANIMLGRGGEGGGAGRGSNNTLFAIWISERINNNAKFSDIIYDLITASGSLSENPAVAPLVRERPFRIANAAGLLTKNLTGIQIQCAECHDHPYEEAWKQSTFFGVASFFAPINQVTNVRSLPIDPAVNDNARAPRLPAGMGENLPPEVRERLSEAAKYNKAITLDGKAVLTPNREFWRPYLAKWTISRENMQTARYVANRFWSFAFGLGLHNPVDDFNSLNTATHPELLEALAADLIASNYDIKRLYRTILNSATYQLSGKDAPAKAEAWHFASYPTRQLTPEQFFGALLTVGGGNELARGIRGNVDPAQVMRRTIEARRRQQGAENMRDYDFNEDALKRYESWFEKMSDGWALRRSLAAGFSSQSSDDEMTEVDSFNLTIDQALAVMNGNVVNRLSGGGRGTVAFELVQRVKGDEARLEVLFLTALSRRPAASEKTKLLAYISAQKEPVAAWEDVLFALLAGTEFATNH